jgi:hypothetical protein
MLWPSPVDALKTPVGAPSAIAMSMSDRKSRMSRKSRMLSLQKQDCPALRRL